MPFLERLGLHRAEVRAWALYDWAISAVQTTVLVAVFPIFYIQVAGAEAGATKASQWWALSNAIATAIVAIISPILGAVADYAGAKKKLLAAVTLPGAAGCAAMYFIDRGDLPLASALFIGVTVAASAALVFYDALLPHITSPSELDRVSSAAYAIGYLGGGLLLAVNLVMITLGGASTTPVRLAMVTVAVWWLAFSVPLFRRVPEPPRQLEPDESANENPIRVAFARVAAAFNELRTYKQAFLMLVAFLIYNDGISTFQRMATAYGTEIGIGRQSLIAAILIVQFVGVPATFAFGALARRIGAKRSILAGLAIYFGVSVLAYFMKTATHFYILATLIGLVQGGTQALSRSLFATLIPRHKSGEYFGFYSTFSRFAGIFGPFLFAGVIAATGSSRNAVLSVSLFFVVGGALLLFVKPRSEESSQTQSATP